MNLAHIQAPGLLRSWRPACFESNIARDLDGIAAEKQSSPRHTALLGAAILFAGVAAWHSEIIASAAWAFDHVTESYLVRYIYTIGMGIGTCFG